jgi:hypothetical protein
VLQLVKAAINCELDSETPTVLSISSIGLEELLFSSIGCFPKFVVAGASISKVKFMEAGVVRLKKSDTFPLESFVVTAERDFGVN